MAYPISSGFLTFKRPVVSIRMSKIIDPRPQTPPNTNPELNVHSTPGHQGSANHSASDAFANLKKKTAAPFIAKDVEKNDKSDVHAILGFLLSQCATQGPDDDPDTQRSQGVILLADVLKAVLPICDQHIEGVKNYCKEVNVEENRYQPFVELFNNILQETEKIKVVGLCNPFLNILFHLSDPSIVHALHNGMKTSRKPDIGATQLDTAKSRALSEDKYLTWKEFTVTRALAKPKTSFSWSDFLAVAEFKLGLKSCHDPPEKYGEQLTKTIPPTENVYGPLHTTSVAKTSALPTASKSRAAPPTQPLNIFEMTKQKKEARQQHLDQREAAKKSKKNTRDILVDESDKRGTRSQPSARSEQTPVQTDLMDDTVPPVVQAALYGTEMLCRGSYASHAITLLIQDDVAWIWWFDRQGAIQSAGINFVQDLPYFVALLVAFQRFNLECWGIIGALQPREGSYSGPVFNVEFPDQGLVVTAALKADIYERYNLTGRCTRVYSALGAVNDEDQSLSTNADIGEGLPETKMALKIYWPEWSRSHEADILEKARQLGKSNPAIEGHIPHLLAVYNHDYSTGNIRSRLGFELSGRRVLRALLFKLLQPLDPRELSMKDFMHGWKQCLTCHFHLWKGGIEHGDISFGNLMWDDKNKKGVLCDFDLATLRDSPQKRGRERTGTVPFMAIDLLRKEYFEGKVKRTYRHDVESFIWVLVWASMFHDSTWAGRKKWQTSDYSACQDSKTNFLMVTYSFVSPPDGEHARWRLVEGLLTWLRGFYPLLRIDVRDETIFAEVMEIIEKYWVWGTQDEPISA